MKRTVKTNRPNGMSKKALNKAYLEDKRRDRRKPTH